MDVTHRLSRQDARRIAVRAQLLAAPRPTSLLDTVRRLASVQVDQVNAVAPSPELVCWSRLGAAYRLGDLDRLLGDGALVEFCGLLLPAEDVALYRAEMQVWPGREPLRDWQRDHLAWVQANDAARRDVLHALLLDGPLPARELPDTCEVPWRSSGWNNDRNRMRLLELMERRGEIAVAGREGRDRLWDLAERIHPDEPVVPLKEAAQRRNERRLAALGIARAKGTEHPVESQHVGEAGEPAVVEGVRGTWRVDPAYLGESLSGNAFRGRTALLSPLDRLVFDRKRMTELFDFDYQLEMYKPAARRRWGYYALPVLHGDRLVGKLDATADRDAGVLQVHALHEDEPFSPTLRTAVERELHALARWLGLEPETA